MRKVDNDTYEMIEDKYGRLEKGLSLLEDISEKISDQLQELIASVTTDCGKNIYDILDDIRDAKEEMPEAVEEIYGEIEAYQSSRSDKWHFTPNGEFYADWSCAWSELNNQMQSPLIGFNIVSEIDEGDLALTLECSIEELPPLPEQKPETE